MNPETCAVCRKPAPSICNTDRLVIVHRDGRGRAYHLGCVVSILDQLVTLDDIEIAIDVIRTTIKQARGL